MAYPISLRRIIQIANPVRNPPWGCGQFLRATHVRAAIEAENYITTPLYGVNDADPLIHAQRIAWLVRTGWEDAIEIDVGIPNMGYIPEWPIVDGNHRLYAALLRRDKTILTTITGDLEYASAMFRVAERHLIEP